MTEVLSPVGSIDSFYAAINSGCDAIYLAGNNYGARKAIDKFDIYEIKKMTEVAHKYNVKVYITVNTLIFDDEIDELLKYTDELYLNNVDAFIIQDLGLIELFSNRYKDLDLHISTQRNTVNIEEIKYYERFKNIKRVVLARETSIDIIKEIKKNTNLEIEVFVHGAICMCYSGECLFSSLIFNRSGNRGECAQPCRLKYSLKENDNILSKDTYLLSPKELNTIEYIDKLLEIGVDSLKIEGRIKSPEYVSFVTEMYKEKVKNKYKKITDIEKEIFKRVYNRSFTKGYLFNEDSNNIVNTFRPNHLGIKLGTVLDQFSSSLVIKLENKLTRLDGLRILRNNKEDIGITVDKIYKGNIEVNEASSGDIVRIESYKIKKDDYKGSLVLVTYSKSISEQLKSKIDNEIKIDKIPLNLKLELRLNEYPKLTDTIKNIYVIGDNKVSTALSKPLEYDTINKQLDRFKETPYFLNSLKVEMDKNVFIPLGLLNNLRRELIEKLEKTKEEYNRSINKIFQIKNFNIKKTNDVFIGINTLEQFKASYKLGYKKYYINDLKLYKKLKEEYDDLILIYELDRVVYKYPNIDLNTISVNEIGSITKYNNELYSSSYLNCTNIYACYNLIKAGIKKISLSYELNENNILSFNKKYEETFKTAPNLEIVLYDRCDLMVMKYCLIRHHYKNDKGCKLCTKNVYNLIDRNNESIRVLGTHECGNILLNPKILCLFKYKDELLNSGITNFRINFTVESEEEVLNVLTHYNENLALEGKEYTFGRFNK